MLNISNNRLHQKVDITKYSSGKHIFNKSYYRAFNKFLLVFFIILIIVLFLPWTQHISGKGYVTTLKPDHRPQNIESQIPGRIEKWYVQEGDYVKKGDTILHLSEIKSDYFDDKLLERTSNQIEAKSSSVDAYGNKIDALNKQVFALQNERALKLKQVENKLAQSKLKVKSYRVDLEAAKTNREIAKSQYNRTVTLESEGLKAVRDVEEKRLKLQSTEAKYISQENKLLASERDVINYEVELSRVSAAYINKISKAQSDMFTAQSSQFDTKAQVSKLENAHSNYQKRNNLLFVTSPQDGYINKTMKGGIGETFKAGEALLEIMPAFVDLAVETYVRPLDLPLVHIGEKVRVQFDGWPAIVFSGWENLSYGTYGAKVMAIDRFTNKDGYYRVLLAPDKSDHKWPEAIRVGSGAKTIALLEDVPIWYELWRQLNGFPPNFYQPEKQKKEKSKK